MLEDGARIKMYTDIHKQIDCTVLIQDNMLVTSVYIYVHTDIRRCMSCIVNVMYCVRYPMSHIRIYCVFACRNTYWVL